MPVEVTDLPVRFTAEVYERDGVYTDVDLILHVGEGEHAFTRRLQREVLPLGDRRGDAFPEGVAAVALMRAFQRALNPPPPCPHLPLA